MAAWPIQFHTDAKPGIKRKVDPLPHVDKKKKYEETRKRLFLESWNNNRPWLRNDEERGMTCEMCCGLSDVNIQHWQQASSKKNLFVVGSKNYKLSTIIDHERSNMHVRAVGITQSKEQALTQTTTAHKTIIALKEHTRKDLEYKFRNIHALIKKNRPISDVKWLNQLDRAKGIDHSTTYDNTTAATRFIEFISTTEKEKLNDILSKMKFFSLTMDGSTDDSVAEQETIFLRTCMEGKIVNRFVCIGEPKSTGSADLFAFVQDKLNDNFLSNHMSKFVGFGCDGASNMMGCKSGLVTRLQECYPEVVGIHCLAHRLELSFRDVFKSNKLYGRLSTLLLGLFYFYKNSPKQRKGLRETMSVRI